MSPRDIDCPVPDAYVRDAGDYPKTILGYAARASDAANAYRATIDARRSFEDTMRAGRRMAIAVDALTTAIADSVACGENTLS